jgi:hypothetical protein
LDRDADRPRVRGGDPDEVPDPENGRGPDATRGAARAAGDAERGRGPTTSWTKDHGSSFESITTDWTRDGRPVGWAIRPDVEASNGVRAVGRRPNSVHPS